MGVKDKEFMAQALIQAKLAQDLGEVPVGAVLVLNEKIIASAHNAQISKHDPSAHAEIEVLRLAGQTQQNYRLTESTLFCTLEPCAMCFGALIHARIKRLVFATQDYKTGMCGSCYDLPQLNCFNHKIQITTGIMEDDCKQILQSFFKHKRKK
jgi:tRNA(adenine34) deaminase